MSAQASGLMGGYNIELLIKELLAVKANNEELTSRVERLEQDMETLNAALKASSTTLLIDLPL